jgi:DNA (cytosine-5)-methyltransferase 1
MMRALDLFSAAAGGWSLGLHRAGFITVAACEIVEWRRILYAENNPHVRIYEDVRSLTAGRLVSDLGFLPDIIVGSPPCQDISNANTKGKGIDGERSWLIGFDPTQLADTRFAIRAGWSPAGGPVGSSQGDEGIGSVRPVSRTEAADSDGDKRNEGLRGRRSGIDLAASDGPRDTAKVGRGTRRTRRRTQPASGTCEPPRRDDADAGETERRQDIETGRDRNRQARERREGTDRHSESASTRGSAADTDQTRQTDGRLEPGPRAEETPVDGRGHKRRDEVADTDRDGKPDGAVDAEMGGSESIGGDAAEPWPDWNGGLAHHLRLDDGLSAWVARTRVAIGPGKRTSAASLIVEAFGDAVLPQIPEAIGRAILRTEHALDWTLHIYSIEGDEE